MHEVRIGTGTAGPTTECQGDRDSVDGVDVQADATPGVAPPPLREFGVADSPTRVDPWCWSSGPASDSLPR